MLASMENPSPGKMTDFLDQLFGQIKFPVPPGQADAGAMAARVRQLLAQGCVALAKELAGVGVGLYPEHEELRKLAQVLESKTATPFCPACKRERLPDPGEGKIVEKQPFYWSRHVIVRDQELRIPFDVTQQNGVVIEWACSPTSLVLGIRPEGCGSDVGIFVLGADDLNPPWAWSKWSDPAPNIRRERRVILNDRMGATLCIVADKPMTSGMIALAGYQYINVDSPRTVTSTQGTVPMDAPPATGPVGA